MLQRDWEAACRKIVDIWLESDEGLAFVADIYQTGFDEGWDNRVAHSGPVETDEEWEEYWHHIMTGGPR